MNRISVPACLCKRKLLEKSLYSFYIGKDRVVIFSLIDYLTYIQNNLYSKMNKDAKYTIKTFIKWVDYFYKLQKNSESSFANRFLSKELLFRRILLEKFFSKNLISSVDVVIKENIQNKAMQDVVREGLSQLKPHNIFFNSKYFNKAPSIKENVSSLNYYINMILGMPFNENFYKVWIENFEIYSLGEE